MYFTVALQAVDISYSTAPHNHNILHLLFRAFDCLIKQGKHFAWNLASDAFENRPCLTFVRLRCFCPLISAYSAWSIRKSSFAVFLMQNLDI